ncbi:TetR/AcrR family transcriptional regulator [Nocardia pseudovaccinii]|uniref:TetR/AcrR family transcriptional regulator n=1 Tax=Nocardia pseudovaccinii TaxID=189540 RepID=UPI000AE536FB|nr:TetR/AcrR family transcriptional regulator [Nocardia pseudovaccinii]
MSHARPHLEEHRSWAKGTSKRRRLSSDDLRKRLLDTAVEMLQETGLTVSLAHLNMEELIRAADVPRSSVYREWETKEAFYLDLMEKMIEPAAKDSAFDEETLQVAEAVIEKHQDLLATREGRRAVLREAVRQAVARNVAALSTALSYRTFTALVATLPSLVGADQERILVVLRGIEQQFKGRLAKYYEDLIPQLGLRFKRGYSGTTLALTGSSVIEGYISRQSTNPVIVSTPVMMPGLTEEAAEWHIAAVGFLAVVDGMTEPDPAFGEESARSSPP